MAKTQELGYPAQPFQWSDLDMNVLGILFSSSIVFVRQGPDGKIFIEKWYQQPTKTYVLFWGPRQLVVTREKQYILKHAELPHDIRNILEESAPDPIPFLPTGQQ